MLPAEILRIITHLIDDVETLVSWTQVCTTTRIFCKEKYGEAVFRDCLSKQFKLADDAMRATRIQYLDLQEGWAKQRDEILTFHGEPLDKAWYHRLLNWSAEQVYSACLSRPDKEGWIPWLFEYRAIQINHKLALALTFEKNDDGVHIDIFHFNPILMTFDYHGRVLPDHEAIIWIEEQLRTVYQIRIWETLIAPLQFESYTPVSSFFQNGCWQIFLDSDSPDRDRPHRLKLVFSQKVKKRDLRCDKLALKGHKVHGKYFECEHAMKYLGARKSQRRILLEAKRPLKRLIMYGERTMLVERISINSNLIFQNDWKTILKFFAEKDGLSKARYLGTSSRRLLLHRFLVED